MSAIPLIVTTSGGDATEASRRHLEILEPLGNVSLLERPLRAVTLVSAVQTALRARRRQYQLRENFAERERLVRELERSNEELAEFAHVVSHDLQAPIRMVSSFSELPARRHKGQLDVESDQLIDTIQAGAAAMDALVRTLLNYATVGQESLTPDSVSLRSVVDAVITTLGPAIEEVRAEVSYGDLPTVCGDRVLLQELVQNLVSNALKYRDPKVIPRMFITSERNCDEWIVSVRDNGPGIPPQYQARIFMPLKRLHGRGDARHWDGPRSMPENRSTPRRQNFGWKAKWETVPCFTSPCPRSRRSRRRVLAIWGAREPERIHP